ncbi:hypothetical protein A9Q80_02900 [Cycloclasticus sp. 46_83_sub15_T18]|nr:hypothetical protein A9Q80_02900 [Cycloclasticus sp. 46_83_sub15_T18]
MRVLYVTLFVVFLVLGFVLSILNSAPININYYYGWIELPLSFALLIAFISGTLIGLSTKIWSNVLLRQRNSSLSRRARLSEKEVSNLRTSPVKRIN